MPVYDAAHVPDTVGRGTLDPELEAWLPSGPTLGADVPIAQGRPRAGRPHQDQNRLTQPRPDTSLPRSQMLRSYGQARAAP